MSTQPTSNALGSNAGFAIDPKELNSLRQSARENSPEALKAAATQFEGLFINMMMKSMRDATPKDGVMDNEQSKMFTSMLDQQLSQNMAKRGVGLADVLIRQLSNNRGIVPDAAKLSDASGNSASIKPVDNNVAAVGGVSLDGSLPAKPALRAISQSSAEVSGFQANLQTALESGIPAVLKAVLTGSYPALLKNKIASYADRSVADVSELKSRNGQPAHIRAFEEKLSAQAEEASRTTGIPAKFMLGQAALESGWGKREILAADGSTSHNVFGIKAGASWKGKVVQTATTEYVNGVPERRIEKFRAYDSYADAFRDYAKTLQNNPRYQAVLANAQDLQGFAQGLQRAGYATDPNYAAKLTRIITHSLSA